MAPQDWGLGVVLTAPSLKNPFVGKSKGGYVTHKGCHTKDDDDKHK
jgi:hypothetical protein